MIRTIADVVRGEGAASAMRRAGERVAESIHETALRLRGWRASQPAAAILNVSPGSVAPRTGGVAIQLLSRLGAEERLRSVALLEPRGLRLSAPHPHILRDRDRDFERGIRRVLAVTRARAVQIEGASGVPLDAVLRLTASGIPVILSIHDFALFCARPNLVEQPSRQFCFYSRDLDRCERCLRQTWDVRAAAQGAHRALAREVLQSAKAVIFPSRFLLDTHRDLFALPELAGEVIEPAVPDAPISAHSDGPRDAIAFAGNVQPHKGGHLLAPIARELARGGQRLHVFGGGDRELLRGLRAQSNVTIHGYYTRGTLPSLLVRNHVGLVLLPSIWPESYAMTMTEAWLGGAAVAAFDLGAPAERIRSHGGGFVVPLEAGASGFAGVVQRWSAGSDNVEIPRVATSPSIAARAHVELYGRLGLLP